MEKHMHDGNASVNTCFLLPPQVNSNDAWGLQINSTKLFLPSSPLPMLQMQMYIIFFGTLLFHTFLCRIGIPRFTSMSIVGLILGASFDKEEKIKNLFNSDSQQILGLISSFGYILFLFYIGVKTDMSVVHRTRKKATIIGTTAVMAPFLCGVIVLRFHSSQYLENKEIQNLGFITGMLSLTSYPVISSILNDLKILNSELGRLGLSSALVSEIFTMFMTSTVAFSHLLSEHGVVPALVSLTVAISFVLLVMFIIRPAMFWIIKQTPEGSLVSDHYVYCLFIMALLTAYVTLRIEFYGMMGPYILGLAVPEGPPLGTAIIKKIDTIANRVLMPIFVTTFAMRVDLNDLVNWKVNGTVDQFMVQTLTIMIVTFIGKFVACMIPPYFSGMPINDTLSLSLIMSCKGIVEMALYTLIKDDIGIHNNVLSLLMVCMILSSTVTPMLLSFLYDPRKKYISYTKRSIIDLAKNSELRVLTCIHEHGNILSTINILEATYPTKDQQLYTYVLHLVELVGRASPIFINHQLQRKKKTKKKTKKNDTNSYLSDKLIDAFKNLEQEFPGSLTVNAFTAMSPAETRYDDICSLALDKLTSLIVLPFHRKWPSQENSDAIEDESLRDLNYRVMERAPCSVGILIEREQVTHTFSPETPYTVCLLFIGGRDDREALCFAMRMTKNPHVRLTILKLLDSNANKENNKDWEAMFDSELFRNIKVINNLVGGTNNVKYIEENVKNGPETVLIIRRLVSEYDLIIVGRQAGIENPQTYGLLQWSEYPELGVLGDLLASTDVPGKASAFVIQQQRTVADI